MIILINLQFEYFLDYINIDKMKNSTIDNNLVENHTFSLLISLKKIIIDFENVLIILIINIYLSFIIYYFNFEYIFCIILLIFKNAQTQFM